VSKFFGFLLGVVVALAGPAVFGVLAADGGIELNAKEMALAYGIGALIFWAVVSYFSGAGALGAALVFGVMIYTVHWIPNRMTNFLNDVPGVTTGMIEGVKQYTLNGVVPILAAISLVYGIQLIVRSVQRRRRERAEAERAQREQELAQAQQAAEVAAQYAPAAAYPVAGGDYQPPAENRFSGYGNTSYEDLFDDEEEPAPVQPRNQADEQTAMIATAAADPYADEDPQPDTDDETRLVPTNGDETVLVPTASSENENEDEDDSPAEAAGEVTVQAETPAIQEETAAEEPVAQGDDPAEDETQLTPTSTPAAPATPAPAAPTEPTAATPAAPAQAAAETPAAPAPAAPPVQPSSPEPTTPKPGGTAQAAAVPVSTGEPASGVRADGVAETVGQQYRERMDGPEPEDTGEHHFGAFENPMHSDQTRPQAPRVMDLPGQFRPAGT